MTDYEDVLKFIAGNREMAESILNASLSLPNIKMPTMGGEVFWTDLAEYNGWRIQQNDITHHARILDPENVRVAWGTVNGMYRAMDRLVESMKGSRYANTAENSDDAMERLRKLKELYDIGALTETEYNEKKRHLLDSI